MASPQSFPTIRTTTGTVLTRELITQKLQELGQGPFTPEQQRQRDILISYLKRDNLGVAPASTSGTFSAITSISQQSNVNVQTITVDSQPNVQQNINQQILDKKILQELVKEVDPTEQLDEDVEDMLLQVADDFIENIINTSCQLAKHRKSNTLEAKDVQFHLERNFNIWIPGFSTEELKPFKKSYGTEAHKQRLQLIKKSTQSTINKPNETSK